MAATVHFAGFLYRFTTLTRFSQEHMNYIHSSPTFRQYFLFTQAGADG